MAVGRRHVERGSMGNWNDVSRERRVDRPLEGELKALDSRSCATVVGRVALFPSPSSLEELLPSRIFRIVVEYRRIWVDCPSSSSTTKFIFSLFSSLSLHSFFDKTAKVNRTDTRPVTRNFPGKERSNHNGGNRVGIFSTSSPSPRGAFLLSERRRYVIDRISRVSKIGDVIAAMAARKVSRRVARYFAARSWRETTDSFVS